MWNQSLQLFCARSILPSRISIWLQMAQQCLQHILCFISLNLCSLQTNGASQRCEPKCNMTKRHQDVFPALGAENRSRSDCKLVSDNVFPTRVCLIQRSIPAHTAGLCGLAGRDCREPPGQWPGPRSGQWPFVKGG